MNVVGNSEQNPGWRRRYEVPWKYRRMKGTFILTKNIHSLEQVLRFAPEKSVQSLRVFFSVLWKLESFLFLHGINYITWLFSWYYTFNLIFNKSCHFNGSINRIKDISKLLMILPMSLSDSIYLKKKNYIASVFCYLYL